MQSATNPVASRHPDRRSSPRHKVELAARVQVLGQPWLNCTVRDISPMGALLDFASPTMVPASFRLLIPVDLFDVECEVRHQNGRRVGVTFLSNRQGAVARYSSVRRV